ncbi:hypothetical protein JCM8547_006306, partial [Rhodosporidiobolus lusitaniae]
FLGDFKNLDFDKDGKFHDEKFDSFKEKDGKGEGFFYRSRLARLFRRTE